MSSQPSAASVEGPAGETAPPAISAKNGAINGPGVPEAPTSGNVSLPAQAGEGHMAHQYHPGHNAAPPRPTWLTTALVVLLALAVISATVAVLARRGESDARTAAHKAAEERDHAVKAEAEVKGQRDYLEKELQTAAKERDQALKTVKSAQQAAEDAKNTLAFFQQTIFSGSRPKAWGVAADKNVTLAQALDAAEREVASAFADRPLVEASIRTMFGAAYRNVGKADEAVKQYERALALREAILGADNPETIACRNDLAVAYRLAGRTTEAGQLYTQATDTAAHAKALAVHGATLLSLKKPVEAELKLRECLATRERLQPGDWSTFDAKSLLGEALLAQKKYAAAEPLLLSGYEGLNKRKSKIPAPDRVRISKALERLVQLYEAWDKRDEAARWRTQLEAWQAAKE